MQTPWSPNLSRVVSEGVAFWTDVNLAERGVRIAFTERKGGVSVSPYESLDLAAHVGDDPRAVDVNRDRLLRALGLGEWRTALTMAEQVHGVRVVRVDGGVPGAGAFVRRGPSPIPGTDALLTSVPGLPLLMCFADCVPLVMCAPGPVVAVVHAGWRGALARLPGLAIARLSEEARCTPSDVVVYVGPHIGHCLYRVDAGIMSQFVHTFDTVARAESGGLDLGAVVAADLARSGVPTCRIVSLGLCTAEQTDRFFSYRAEGGVTGRHGALACILP